MGFFIGEVVNITDDIGAGRIKARIRPADNSKSDSELDYATPLLPGVISIKPKKGESVIILSKDDDPRGQRFFIGPIITQPQRLNNNSDYTSNLSTLKGGKGYIYPNLELYPKSEGSFAAADEVAIYSRKNSDVILSDNDVRIRCGCRIMNPNSKRVEDVVKFNNGNPSYLKLNFYESPLMDNDGKQLHSSATLVGQHINLISTEGTPYFDNITNGSEKLISDDALKNIIEKAHPLPYGDNLIEFLLTFVKAFNNHTHNYTNLPPVPDSTYKELQTSVGKIESILSKNVRIN